MNELILIGASGLAREVAMTVEATRTHRIIGIVDDDTDLHGTEVAGIPVLGDAGEIARHPDAQLLVCIGHGSSRRSVVRRLAGFGTHSRRFATVIHPSVHVPSSCSVGAGSILLAHVALTADVRIGQHVVVMPNATLTHDNAVGDFATLCAGVSLAGMVTVGEGAYLGTNSCVREFVHVGVDSTLGMGASLLSDLPDGEIWAGTPAHELIRKPTPLTIARPLQETS